MLVAESWKARAFIPRARFMGAAVGRANRLKDIMSEPGLVDITGRLRSPAATPGHWAGCAPPNKGLRYPADPPTVEETILVMREAGPGPYADSLRALIAILWRAGVRISEALAPDPATDRPVVLHPDSRSRPRRRERYPCCPRPVALSGQSAPPAWLLLVAEEERGWRPAGHARDQISSTSSAPAPSARTGSGGRVSWSVRSCPSSCVATVGRAAFGLSGRPGIAGARPRCRYS